MNTNFHTESRMREICTYGSMRGRAYPTRGVPLYSTPQWWGKSGGVRHKSPPFPCAESCTACRADSDSSRLLQPRCSPTSQAASGSGPSASRFRMSYATLSLPFSRSRLAFCCFSSSTESPFFARPHHPNPTIRAADPRSPLLRGGRSPSPTPMRSGIAVSARPCDTHEIFLSHSGSQYQASNVWTAAMVRVMRSSNAQPS